MFSLTIETSGAAFDDEGLHQEISRALRDVADRIENGSSGRGVIRDSKGNRIGSFVIVGNTDT
jgi:hypothetical protein